MIKCPTKNRLKTSFPPDQVPYVIVSRQRFRHTRETIRNSENGKGREGLEIKQFAASCLVSGREPARRTIVGIRSDVRGSTTSKYYDASIECTRRFTRYTRVIDGPAGISNACAL